MRNRMQSACPHAASDPWEESILPGEPNQVIEKTCNALRLVSLLLLAPTLSAVIVDRIAVTAGNQVITDSEIDQRIRLTAFENGVKPDFTAAMRKAAADRLIDRKLVEHEMDVGHYPRIGADRRSTLLAGYAKDNFKSDNAAMNKELAAFGLTPAELEDDLARQADLLTFLSVRFRPEVQVTEQDIRDYARQKSLSVDDFRAQIERALTNQRADADMDAWLKDQRRRAKVQYLEKELAP